MKNDGTVLAKFINAIRTLNDEQMDQAVRIGRELMAKQKPKDAERSQGQSDDGRAA